MPESSCANKHIWNIFVSKIILNIMIQATYFLYNKYSIMAFPELLRRLSGPSGLMARFIPGTHRKKRNGHRCSDSYTCSVHVCHT